MWSSACCISKGMSLSDVRALMARLADARRAHRLLLLGSVRAHFAVVRRADDAEENEARKKLRLDTLHAIEQGGNETAAVAELISTAVLRRHLETMLRLDIEYDFLPRESEILHLHFWDAGL